MILDVFSLPGSHLVTALLARGHEVVVLDDLSTGRSENLEMAVAEAVAAPIVPSGDAGETATSDSSVRPVLLPDQLRFIKASLLDYDALGAALVR